MAVAARPAARFEPGISRWSWLVTRFLAIPHHMVLVLRVVVAYAALMTDEHPPVRPGTGEGEPAGPDAGTVPSAEPPSPPPARPKGAARVVALVLGSLIGLGSLGLVAAGVAGLVVDQTQRDADGYLSSAAVHVASQEFAVVATGLDVDTDAPGWLQEEDIVGQVRLRYDAGAGDVFVGVAPASDAGAYLDGLGYDEITRIEGDDAGYAAHAGGAPASDPAAQDFWTASASGTGQQTLTFQPHDGQWVVVAMNADGTAGVDLTARAAAELPVLPWVALIAIGAGGLGLLVAALLVYLALRRDRTRVGA
ncbi:hypothetical protein [Jiangella endophytica]|uniref:hypothetical protein n=1 Tax=Jiangella endophytica TaxID=1623398 RepID=UPI0013002116|nr:hypothetical protein [Jiangella endophytica]